MFYSRYGTTEEEKNSKINFTVNVSLRDTEEFNALTPLKDEVLGCYVGLYFNSFKGNYTLNDNIWQKELWENAKDESEKFHKRLKSGQFVAPIILVAPRKKDEFFYHFANSNIGNVRSSLTENKLIVVKQSFTTARYSKENNFCWFTNLIATINDQLCWTISFNSFYVKQEFITVFIGNLSKIIKELIKDTN